MYSDGNTPGNYVQVSLMGCCGAPSDHSNNDIHGDPYSSRDSSPCCLPALLQSSSDTDEFGELVGSYRKKLHVKAHGSTEISVSISSSDSVAWGFKADNEISFSSYWFDCSKTNQESDCYAVEDCFPSRKEKEFAARVTMAGRGVTRGTVVLKFDNDNLARKKVEVSIQVRSLLVGVNVLTPFGNGHVAGRNLLNTLEIKLPFGVLYCPRSTDTTVSAEDVELLEESHRLEDHDLVLLREPIVFRVQDIHQPFKYVPSPECCLGVHQIGGAFKWTAGTSTELWDMLSETELSIIKTSLEGIDWSHFTDYHVHVVGSGQNGSGCYITPKMSDPLTSPFGYVKLKIFMSASGIVVSDSDATYEKRLLELLHNMATPFCSKPTNKAVCLGFEKVYDEDGTIRWDKTTLHIPNDYAVSIANRHPDHCIPCCSVHPYRLDFAAELDRCYQMGCRLIKWLPNSMMIDPLSELCDPFYAKVRSMDMIILCHTGEEHSVDSAGLNNELGNPLRLRRALDMGVKVIAAHMATEGTAFDLDSTASSSSCSKLPRAENFDLLLRLFREDKYQGLLFADFSAVCCIKRAKYLERLLDATDIHGRIVYGSDYPVPALNFAVVVSHFISNFVLIFIRFYLDLSVKALRAAVQAPCTYIEKGLQIQPAVV